MLEVAGTVNTIELVLYYGLRFVTSENVVSRCPECSTFLLVIELKSVWPSLCSSLSLKANNSFNIPADSLPESSVSINGSDTVEKAPVAVFCSCDAFDALRNDETMNLAVRNPAEC